MFQTSTGKMYLENKIDFGFTIKPLLTIGRRLVDQNINFPFMIVEQFE